MNARPLFAVEPWSVREAGLDLGVLAQSESVFALANGHIGLRANLDEGEPYALPGTYLNSFYELRPLPYAEAGYGYPESGQTIVNVTDGKIIRLLVDDEPFDVRYGQLLAHERVLDLRAGTLHRRAEWRSAAGTAVRIRSTRLVSFVQRAAAAILYEVEPLERPVRVVVQSELVANEPAPPASADPRAAAALDSPLVAGESFAHAARVVLVHSTRASGLGMAAGMDHLVDGPDGTETAAESGPDIGRVTVAADLAPGERLQVVKFLAYGWSSQRSHPALRDEVVAALTEARHTGWDGLLAGQRAYLADFWDHADVELEGDTELQQAVRFALFHTLQAGARAEQRAIAAKGLTGPGYDGHTFWDAERFVLPVLTYTAPHAAGDALRWRHSTLDLARERARQLGLAGAAFPWRTIRGHECSGYWPAGSAAFHVSADVADAVVRYQAATGDDAFERNTAPSPTTTSTPTCSPSATCAPPPTPSPATPATPPRSAPIWKKRPPGATPPAPWSSPGTKHSASTRNRKGSPATSAGTSTTPTPTSTRSSSITPTSSCTENRSSSRPTSCSPSTSAATPSATRRRHETSPTTKPSPCAIPRSRPAPKPSSRPRSATSNSPTTTSVKPH
jgi:alpha,alpha-trehalose phosphorylase